ncbi:helix-turn-helix family protein [Brevibacillus laterosporus GI-9]|uniref:helix-turn-helix transcriptional regulator n=1 Tax=Brevibacillus laterosporus TaxID=1465 RepID=UPI0002404DFF|nr:helix-turn-helix transcriptional regulator [Brevibacillus laterosporus]CCF14640.1 helix-turn-helix family protein [Brevibacillus laterosporus GI-9]
MEKEGKIRNDLFMLRAKKRWSQKEVADKLGVSRQTIVSLEANRYNPSLMLAFKIAHLFEVDINEVFQYEVDKGDVPEC